MEWAHEMSIDHGPQNKISMVFLNLIYVSALYIDDAIFDRYSSNMVQNIVVCNSLNEFVCQKNPIIFNLVEEGGSTKKGF